jgi:hypothetical protein
LDRDLNMPRRSCIHPSALCLLLLASGALRAQTLADPTRPPQRTAPRATEPARPGLGAARAAQAAPPHLQSVLLAKTGAHSALIDGRLVRPGDAVATMTVVQIDSQGVTLGDARGAEQRLALYASVQLTQRAAADDLARAREPLVVNPRRDAPHTDRRRGEPKRDKHALALRLTEDML